MQLVTLKKDNNINKQRQLSSLFMFVAQRIVCKRTTRINAQPVQINHLSKSKNRQQSRDKRQQKITQSDPVNNNNKIVVMPLCVKSIIKCHRFGAMRKSDEFLFEKRKTGRFILKGQQLVAN